jgi:hypothetical protein
MVVDTMEVIGRPNTTAPRLPKPDEESLGSEPVNLVETIKDSVQQRQADHDLYCNARYGWVSHVL